MLPALMFDLFVTTFLSGPEEITSNFLAIAHLARLL